MAARSKFIIPFTDIHREDLPLPGIHATELTDFFQQKASEGFILTTQAYHTFLQENNLTTVIQHLLSPVNFDNKHSVQKASQNIKKYILQGKMPHELVQEVFQHYKKLGGIFTNAKVAMIPSLVFNDLHTFSTALEKHLPVKGEANILIHMRELWTTIFESQAIIYRYKNNIDHFATAMAIVIQKYKEELPLIHKLSSQNHPAQSLLTATKLYVTLAKTDNIDILARKYIDGALFLYRKKILERHAIDDITTICTVFSPRPILYSLSHFTTTKNLQLELETIRIVRNESKCKNIWLVLPFVRTTTELMEVKRTINKVGLYRSPTFKLFFMINLPVHFILLDRFIGCGLDGVIIDADQLTPSILGIDHNNSLLFEQTNEAQLRTFEHIIKTTQKHAIPVIFYSKTAATYSPLVEKLVQWGITSISVPSHAIADTRRLLTHAEKELVKK